MSVHEMAPDRAEHGGVIHNGFVWYPGNDGYEEAKAAADAADAADADRLVAEMEANTAGEELIRINESGIIPTEFKVLVLPDESEVELRARRSGLVVPDEAAGQYRHAAVTGRIIAMSPAAFSYHDWPAGTPLPTIGDRVVYARYAGMRVNGRPLRNEKGHEEAKEYRLLNDKDVAAVLEF
jgi:co-chaperonin GroES (HSP10)